MFNYDGDLSNGKLCELFAEHGGFLSDGIDLIRRVGPLYRTVAQKEIPMELRKLLTPETRLNISPHRLSTIIDLLRQNPDIYVDTAVRDTGNIIFRNGIYNAREGRLYPHDGRYNWAVVDADYEEGVRLEDAPTFLNFLASSLDYPEHPRKAELLLEIMGYCLSDFTAAKKSFFFVGEPSSGKSKILEFLQRLIGDEEVSQIALPLIGGRFSMGQLRGKRLNVCTELPSDKFPSIESFKALTACDRVYGELKGQDGFNYYPRVKLLNAGNSVPFPKKTDGTFSVIERMTFLMFCKSLPRSQWNLNLVDDLLAEKDAICSLAMERLKNLVDSGFKFTLPEDSKVFAQGYADSLNAFNLFISGCCELHEDAHVSSQQLWESYKEFCANNAFPPGIDQQLFAQKMAVFNGVSRKRLRSNGRQITVFYGIAMRSAFGDLTQNKELCDEEETDKNSGKQSVTKIRKAPTMSTDADSSCTKAHALKGGLKYVKKNNSSH